MTSPLDGTDRGAGCQAESVGAVLVYRLHGDLDFDTRDMLAFGKPLEDFYAVVVDLAQVTFFGSTPLNALLDLRRRAEPLGIPVHLCAVPATAARVLQVTGAARLFPLHRDLDTALALTRGEPPAP